MTREQYLNILILLSALESLILAHKVHIPDYLFAEMERGTELLRKEILK
jgi:hypothetical protein